MIFPLSLTLGYLPTSSTVLLSVAVPHPIALPPSYPILSPSRQLTHGFFQKLTSSGRVADCWEGATLEISKRLGKSSHNLVDRQGEGRHVSKCVYIYMCLYRYVSMPICVILVINHYYALGEVPL